MTFMKIVIGILFFATYHNFTVEMTSCEYISSISEGKHTLRTLKICY